MDSIEQAGRNVDEAVEAALKALGVSRDEVDVEVLAEERRGLLGILGSSSARVRVTVQRDAAQPSVPAEPPELESEEPQPSVAAVEVASELAERAVEILTRILALMGLEATAEVTGDDEESVSINIRSEDDLGLLIGRRGQTLSALQLIVAIMANRQLLPDARRRVILDAEGYRARRDRSLQSMARDAAQRAKRSGRPVTLSSLNPRERRVVHVALADDPSVTTRSEGDDPDRSIIVTARRGNR
jgi:spoIIIJ-associated protein